MLGGRAPPSDCSGPEGRSLMPSVKSVMVYADPQDSHIFILRSLMIYIV